MKVIQPTFKIPTPVFKPSTKELVGELHRWISTKALDDILIDVADYQHVHRGPGVLLVAHEAYYGIDEQGGVRGLLYRARRGEPKAPALHLMHAAAKALRAGRLLEQAFSQQITFATDRIEVGFDDRLRAPSNRATFDAMRPELEQFAEKLLGPKAGIEYVDAPARCLRIALRCPEPEPLEALLARTA